MLTIPKDLSPEMLVNDPSLLLHAKPRLSELTAGDGLVGAVIAHGHQIITSPNCKAIFYPPLGGDRSVFMRSDLRFGDDDPLQWPQPYIEEARYLACIPKQPIEESALSIMWWIPAREDFDKEDHGIIVGIGKLSWSRLRKLAYVSRQMTTRAKQPLFEGVASALQLSQTLEDIIHRLEHISTSFRSVQLGVRALQRVYLELVAVLDHHEIYEPLMTGRVHDHPSTTEHRMGVFTSDLNVCQKMYRAGIPVWFIRPYRVLHSIRIVSVTNVQQASGLIELEPASRPRCPPIYRGSVDSPEAYRALARHTSSFLRYPDPFGSVRAEMNVSPPLPAPGPSKREIRSQRYTPYAGRKKDPAAPPGGRNKFEDFPSPLLPPAIPSWRQSLESVNIVTAQFRYPEVIPADLGYVFPEPASFLSIQSSERQTGFFKTWLKYRSTLIYRMSLGSSDAKPMPNTVWRTLLSDDFVAKGRDAREGKMGTRSHKVKEATKNFLQSCLDAEGVVLADTESTNVPVTWNGKAFDALTANEFEEILWELAELNFRFELMALDRRATTAPLDDRHGLLAACFPRSVGGASLLVADLSGANQGLASVFWEDRGTYVLALQNLMSSWRGNTLPVMDVNKFYWNPKQMDELEDLVTRYYCKTFYEYFRRAPIVPRRLSHAVAPYHPPTPEITIQDPRPNIFYNITALAL